MWGSSITDCHCHEPDAEHSDQGNAWISPEERCETGVVGGIEILCPLTTLDSGESLIFALASAG